MPPRSRHKRVAGLLHIASVAAAVALFLLQLTDAQAAPTSAGCPTAEVDHACLAQLLQYSPNSDVELFAQLVLGCAGVKVGPLHVAHSPPLAPATSPQPENGTGAAAPSPSSHAVILEPAVTAVLIIIIVVAVGLAAGFGYTYWLRSKHPMRDWGGKVIAPRLGPSTTLLVTDIEGSTNLWETLPQEVMTAVIEIHHALVRQLTHRHLGYESATEGDSFILAFHTASSALAFAHDFQLQLLTQDWPPELLAQSGCGPVFMASRGKGPRGSGALGSPAGAHGGYSTSMAGNALQGGANTSTALALSHSSTSRRRVRSEAMTTSGSMSEGVALTWDPSSPTGRDTAPGVLRSRKAREQEQEQQHSRGKDSSTTASQLMGLPEWGSRLLGLGGGREASSSGRAVSATGLVNSSGGGDEQSIVVELPSPRGGSASSSSHTDTPRRRAGGFSGWRASPIQAVEGSAGSHPRTDAMPERTPSFLASALALNPVAAARSLLLNLPLGTSSSAIGGGTTHPDSSSPPLGQQHNLLGRGRGDNREGGAALRGASPPHSPAPTANSASSAPFWVSGEISPAGGVTAALARPHKGGWQLALDLEPMHSSGDNLQIKPAGGSATAPPSPWRTESSASQALNVWATPPLGMSAAAGDTATFLHTFNAQRVSVTEGGSAAGPTTPTFMVQPSLQKQQSSPPSISSGHADQAPPSPFASPARLGLTRGSHIESESDQDSPAELGSFSIPLRPSQSRRGDTRSEPGSTAASRPQDRSSRIVLLPPETAPSNAAVQVQAVQDIAHPGSPHHSSTDDNLVVDMLASVPAQSPGAAYHLLDQEPVHKYDVKGSFDLDRSHLKQTPHPQASDLLLESGGSVHGSMLCMGSVTHVGEEEGSGTQGLLGPSGLQQSRLLALASVTQLVVVEGGLAAAMGQGGEDGIQGQEHLWQQDGASSSAETRADIACHHPGPNENGWGQPSSLPHDIPSCKVGAGGLGQRLNLNSSTTIINITAAGASITRDTPQLRAARKNSPPASFTFEVLAASSPPLHQGPPAVRPGPARDSIGGLGGSLQNHPMPGFAAGSEHLLLQQQRYDSMWRPEVISGTRLLHGKTQEPVRPGEELVGGSSADTLRTVDDPGSLARASSAGTSLMARSSSVISGGGGVLRHAGSSSINTAGGGLHAPHLTAIITRGSHSQLHQGPLCYPHEPPALASDSGLKLGMSAPQATSSTGTGGRSQSTVRWDLPLEDDASAPRPDVSPRSPSLAGQPRVTNLGQLPGPHSNEPGQVEGPAHKWVAAPHMLPPPVPPLDPLTSSGIEAAAVSHVAQLPSMQSAPHPQPTFSTVAHAASVPAPGAHPMPGTPPAPFSDRSVTPGLVTPGHHITWVPGASDSAPSEAAFVAGSSLDGASASELIRGGSTDSLPGLGLSIGPCPSTWQLCVDTRGLTSDSRRLEGGGNSSVLRGASADGRSSTPRVLIARDFFHGLWQRASAGGAVLEHRPSAPLQNALTTPGFSKPSHAPSGSSYDPAAALQWVPTYSSTSTAPPAASPTAGEPALVFRGLRVRCGLHSGVHSPQDLLHNKTTGRLTYTGTPLAVAKLIADAGQGGMVLLSHATFEQLTPECIKEFGLLLNLGTYVMLKDLSVPATTLYQAVPTPLAPRLSLFCHPCGSHLRSADQQQTGILEAPVGCTTICFVQIDKIGSLMSWDRQRTEGMITHFQKVAQSVLSAETQHETSNRHGYIVEMAGGLLLTAWAQPSAAINWALALEVALRATDWDPELLDHPLCEPVRASATPQATSPAADRLGAARSIGHVASSGSSGSRAASRTPELSRMGSIEHRGAGQQSSNIVAPFAGLNGGSSNNSRQQQSASAGTSGSTAPQKGDRASEGVTPGVTSPLTQRSQSLVQGVERHTASGSRRLTGAAAFLYRGPRIRVGMDQGVTRAVISPVTGRMEYRGRCMNRAARVCSVAPCGQVWATAQAWSWATEHEAGAVSATQLQADDMGHFNLKGVTEEVSLVRCTRGPLRLSYAGTDS